MNPFFTCREVTERLTLLDEGALPPLAAFRLRFHLAMCEGCRAFLASLRAVPRLMRAAAPVVQATPAEARAALQGALAALGRRRVRIPAPFQAVLDAEPLLKLQAEAQRHLLDGAPQDSATGLPEPLKAQLPALDRLDWWRWGFGGARLARLADAPERRNSLYLLDMPPGGRFPRHRHPGLEGMLVLQGGLVDGSLQAEPGDWIHCAAGHPEHAPGATAEGCKALIWFEHGAVRFTGWRGWVQKLVE